jgi:hypothetical protein
MMWEITTIIFVLLGGLLWFQPAQLCRRYYESRLGGFIVVSHA